MSSNSLGWKNEAIGNKKNAGKTKPEKLFQQNKKNQEITEIGAEKLQGYLLNIIHSEDI